MTFLDRPGKYSFIIENQKVESLWDENFKGDILNRFGAIDILSILFNIW